MATVCGTSLALMDAGVPLKRPTAGIAMGLILEDKRYAVLSDILGDEDHLGDMDFKVAGTEQGVTALQMDIKIAGITEEIMKVALGQAKGGRLHILGEMSKALDTARAELGEHAPRIETFKIADRQDPRGDRHRRQGDPRDRREDRRQDQRRGRRHREGRVRRRRSRSRPRSTGSSRSPPIRRSATSTKARSSRRWTSAPSSTSSAPRTAWFTSASSAASRVQKTTDVVKEGDKVKVKLLGFDERGKVRLSMKVVDQATGEDLEAKQKQREPRVKRGAAAPNKPHQLRIFKKVQRAPPGRRFSF